jgi:hypothetical protein
MPWDVHFVTLFEHCEEAYRGGNLDFGSYYSAADLEFLSSIGYKPRELFDFIEDLVEDEVPAMSTALLIAAVRRDYLLTEQDGVLSDHEITHDDLPSFGDELAGIPYLPRIITKARAKLRGELDPDIMYSCGGDRAFLRKHGLIHPADFLRHVWAARDNDQAIADYVLECMND